MFQEINFPHSLGMLYSAVTFYLGFAVNDGEYKVMGMAPFGEPRFADQVRKLIHLDDGGGFELDLDYFCYHWHPQRPFTDKMVELLGQPRFPGSP
ncbi:MAG TPA: hypothetical protein EYQ50_20965, partial [Verrucomicrobiales bacterium]|nr:hypothetical protein [Verrucomicrobiales bacterium]